MFADRECCAGLLCIGNWRELQLIAPAVHVREQPAGRLGKRRYRDIRLFSVLTAHEEAAFAKTGRGLFLPAGWGGPLNARPTLVRQSDGWGCSFRLRLFWNAIDSDLRVVAAAVQDEEQPCAEERLP